MSIYDIIILTVIGLFALNGLWRGFIKEVFGALGLLAGFLLAWRLAPPLGAALPPRAIPEAVRIIVVGVVILVAVMLAFAVVGWIVRKIVAHGPIKMLDRLGGLFVGALKGALAILALAVFLWITPLGATLLKKSESSPVLMVTMRLSRPFGERYQRELVASVVSSVQGAVSIRPPSKGKSAPHNPQPAQAKVIPQEMPTSLVIDLDKLDPGTELLLKQVLKDPSFKDLGLAERFDEIRAAGVSTIDISLDELTPESRELAVKYLTEVDAESVARLAQELLQNGGEIDLEQLSKSLPKTSP